MNLRKKHLFPTPPSVLKKGTVAILCMIMVGLFFVVGCEKKPPVDPPEEIVYPIDILFTEYSPSENCQWTNLNYDDKVIVINSEEELGNYISCMAGSYPEIDFSQYTLLVASGTSTNHIPKIAVTSLQQLSLGNYSLNIETTINTEIVDDQWTKALIVEKINKESDVELSINIVLDPQIDFSNIENLHEQPLSVIQECVRGEWEISRIYRYGCFGWSIILNNTFVDIDVKNNSVFLTVDTCSAISRLRYVNPSSSCSWERKEVYEPYMVGERPPCYTTYVMTLDVKEGDHGVFGWYFDYIRNDSLQVVVDFMPHTINFGYYETYWFLRIKE